MLIDGDSHSVGNGKQEQIGLGGNVVEARKDKALSAAKKLNFDNSMNG